MFVDIYLRAPAPRSFRPGRTDVGVADLIVSIVGFWLAICVLTALFALAFSIRPNPALVSASVEHPVRCAPDAFASPDRSCPVGFCASAHHLTPY